MMAPETPCRSRRTCKKRKQCHFLLFFHWKIFFILCNLLYFKRTFLNTILISDAMCICINRWHHVNRSSLGFLGSKSVVGSWDQSLGTAVSRDAVTETLNLCLFLFVAHMWLGTGPGRKLRGWCRRQWSPRGPQSLQGRHLCCLPETGAHISPVFHTQA